MSSTSTSSSTPRPLVPPKPDKDKINHPSPTGRKFSTDETQVNPHPSKTPETKIPSSNPNSRGVSKSQSASAVLSSQVSSQNQDSQHLPGVSPTPPLKNTIKKPPISPAKPALPPKPGSSVTSPPRKSVISPSSSAPPPLPPPNISTPVFPTGRNSISIANTILANKSKNALEQTNSNNNINHHPSSLVSHTPSTGNSASSGNIQNKNDCFSDPESSSVTRVIRREKSEGFIRNTSTVNQFKSNKALSCEPVSPKPSFTNNPRPFSTIFTFPSPPPPPEGHQNSHNFPTATNFNNKRLELRVKSASLGRNVGPPTSISSGISGFFSSKAVTLSRILPLDLHFGKNHFTSKGRPNTLPPLINIHSSSSMQPNQTMTSPIQNFGRKISFSTDSPIPPPPPPRLKKKLSPVNSLSPNGSLSPNSPPPVFSPQSPIMTPVTEEPLIYAEIDKEKKWAERRLKEKATQIKGQDINEESKSAEETSSQGTDETDQNTTHGIQASLVININRNTDNKVESLSVDEKSQIFVADNANLVKSLSSHFELQIQDKKSELVKTEEIVVDSWLGKYLSKPISHSAPQSKNTLNNICETMNSIVLTDLSKIHCSADEKEKDTTNESKTQSVFYVEPLEELQDQALKPEYLVNGVKQEKEEELVENESFLFNHLLKSKEEETNKYYQTQTKDHSSNIPQDEMEPTEINSNNGKVETNMDDTVVDASSQANNQPCVTTITEMDKNAVVVNESVTDEDQSEVPDLEKILHLVNINIQSVVTQLSSLSGKVTGRLSPSQTKDDDDDSSSANTYTSIIIQSIPNELETLSITEDPAVEIEEPEPLQELTLLKDNLIVTSPETDDYSKALSYNPLPSTPENNTTPLPRRSSWNCSADSSSPCHSSTSSLNNIRDRYTYTTGRPTWVDEGDLSTGALADTENSDVQIPSSSAEDIGATGSLSRRKRLWIFRSFGKPGSSSSSGSSNGHQRIIPKGKYKDKSQSFMPESNGKSTSSPGKVGRQISNSVILTKSLISGPIGFLEESPKEKTSQSQFSPDVIDTPIHRYRYSESSEPGELAMCPEGDNDSFSSVGSSLISYACCISPGYEDILADLSPKDRKAFYVAREILTSEQTFVNVLDILTVHFPNAIKHSENLLKQPIIPPHDLDGILAGLPNLKRVNEELMLDLEDRIKNWKDHPKLADVIVKKGPFLKLYAHYIKNFEKTTQILDTCCQRYPHFAKVLKEFELSDRCQKLGLKHYMLKPVQRMPQYRLLLEDYLKNIEQDSGDYQDTVKALGIVKDVAEHANEAIKLQVNAEKLMHLQARLAGSVIMKSDRQLFKEGELHKVCRKGLQPRFFALMNDCLLCMTYNVGSGSDLKLRYELPLAGMRVCLTATEDYPNEFSVISIARSFNLVAKSAREREDWMKALNDAIYFNIKKRACSTPDKEIGFELGRIAPVWIQDSRVTMCQICTAEFTAIFRRHHCRACGKVVCGYCSGNSAPLQYLKNDAARVCDECFQFLLEEFDQEAMTSTSAEGLETSRDTIRNRFKKVTPNVSKRATKVKRSVPSRLEVHANNSGSRISSYLHCKERKAWKRHWYVLMERVMYIYAASEDIIALRTVPVLGWEVSAEENECMDGADNQSVFKLTHTGQNTLLFQAENPTLAEKWINALKEATDPRL